MGKLLREAVQPSIGYVTGYPGRDEDQCSCCGVYPSEQYQVQIHKRRRDDSSPDGWRHDSQLDAWFDFCPSCYFTLIAYMHRHGTEYTVNELRGYR